ncbi:hypothetical protein [Nocardia sp. NPDC005745]|uniref:hypothetical protein n=1 Tax=Nocardia sp. NPDC005745 TaxID=3157061 RepID=UPI0033F241E9
MSSPTSPAWKKSVVPSRNFFDHACGHLAQAYLAQRLGVVLHVEAELELVQADRTEQFAGDVRPDRYPRAVADPHLGVVQIEEILGSTQTVAVEGE